LVLVSIVGCHRGKAAGPVAAPAMVPVEWSGCAEVRRGPVCELGGDRVLRLWTPAAEGPGWELSTDVGPAIRKTLVQMQGGWAMSVGVPSGAHRLSAVRSADRVSVWWLALGTATAHQELDELVVAGKHGDPQAPARLRALIDDGPADLRGPALAGYGRVMLAQGDVQTAERALREALAADRREGRLSDELRDSSALFWVLVTREHRFADARRLLASVALIRGLFPDAEAWYAQDAAMLALETNDIRAALAGYREAVRRQERLGASEQADVDAHNLALALATEGRSSEAVAILDRLPLPSDPCARATLLINRAEMFVNPGTPDWTPDAQVRRALLEEQRAVERCGDSHRRVLALFHAAQYTLVKGELDRADALVARIKAAASDRDPVEQIWRDEAVGRWSLARGRPAEALSAFLEAADVAQATGLDDKRFRAQVGVGEAQLALGRRSAGVASLETAQELQRRLFEGIPLGESRGEFLSGHTEGVRHLVDALVARVAVDQAMAAARLARAFEVRHAARLDLVRQLSTADRQRWDTALERYAQIRRAIETEARDDWKLAGAALARARLDRGSRADDARAVLDAAFRLVVPEQPARQSQPRLAPGEGELILFPGVNDWIAFVRTPTTVVAHRFSEGALESRASAAAVLAPFARQMRALKCLYVLPFGRADRINWHTVELETRPLIATAEVVYRVDLPESVDHSPKNGELDNALIVTNPTGDLEAAQAEGSLVADALGHWRPIRLEGPRATRDALLKILPTVALFHYAGHALAEGPSGSESSLILADGERADLGDFLALPRIPEVVVLAACQASGGSAMGLAQAFLAAGARFVVAPRGDVDDAETRAFVTRLYEGIGGHGAGALAGAYQRAALKAGGTSADSFRLMVR
jgi:cellulose synthase operon protein C